MSTKMTLFDKIWRQAEKVHWSLIENGMVEQLKVSRSSICNKIRPKLVNDGANDEIVSFDAASY